MSEKNSNSSRRVGVVRQVRQAAGRVFDRGMSVDPLESRRFLSAASLDTAFSSDGRASTNVGAADAASAVLSLAGNKVLTAGTDGKNALLLQYTSAGSLDTTFGGGDGIASVRFNASTSVVEGFSAIRALSGGKFLAAGLSNNTVALARFKADGSLDTTFGPSHTGKVTTTVVGAASSNANAITVQADGKIVVVGTATKANNHDTDIFVLRYTADGAADTTFGTAKNGQTTYDYKGWNDFGNAVGIFSNGKILAGGTVTNKTTAGAAADTDIAVVRFNTDGTLDKTFGNATGIATADLTIAGSSTRDNDAGNAMILSCGSRILIAGSTDHGTTGTTAGLDFALVKFKYDGSLDTKFGPAKTGKVDTDFGTAYDAGYALATTPTNKILVGGYSVTGTTTLSYDFAAARYNADGSADTGFNPSATTTVGKQTLTTNFTTTSNVGSPDAAYAVAVQSDGKFVLAGTSANDIAVARYTGTAPSGDGDGHLCGSHGVTPTKSGVAATGAIDSPTDVDLYAVTVAAGQTLGLDVDATSGSALDSYLRIFDFEGNALTSNDNAAAPGETLGKLSYLKYTFPTAGTYYIGVSGAGDSAYDPVTDTGETSGSTGGYSLVTTDLTAAAPTDAIGNTTGTAKSIVTGSSTSDSIGTGIDIDVYKITATAGQTITFDIDNASGSTLDSYLRLFDSGGTQIASNNDAADTGETLGKSSFLSYTFVTGGTYYVGVSGYANTAYVVTTGGSTVSGSTGGYTLVVSDRTTDAAGGTSGTAKSITLGSGITEVIGTSTDIDVYKFTVTGGQTIAFDTNVSGSFDSYLRLFNSSGTQITFNDNGAGPGEAAGNASYVTYTFTTGGTYYVAVSGHGNSTYNVVTGNGTVAGSTGQYVVTATNITPTGDPDDQISEAHYVTNGAIATDSISNATDVDMYDLSTAAGVTYTFDIDTTSGSSLDSYLRVFNADGTQLASNDNGAAAGETLGTSAFLSYTFTTAGTYYVSVSGAPNKSFNAVTGNGDVTGSTGGYTLTFAVPSNGADPDDQVSEAHPRDLNTTVTDVIGNSTDVDAYSFTATAGTLVGIDVDVPASSSLHAYLEIVLPNGQYTAYNSGSAAPDENYNAGKDAYVEYMVPTTGTYYVFVASESNENFNPTTGNNDVPGDQGAYSLTLTNLTTQDTDDTIDGAHSTAIGGTISDTISNPNDVDVYKFTATAGQTVGFDLDVTAGSKLDGYIEIANSSGQYIAYNSGSAAPDEAYTGTEAYFEYTFTASGTYYLAASAEQNENFNLVTGGNDHAGVSTSAGGYTVHLTDIGAQDSDDQLSEAHSISVGGGVSDTISNPNDVDVYKFTVSAGQKVGFDVDVPAGSALSSYAEVANSAGQYLAYNSGSAAPGKTSNGKDSYIEYTFTTGGTYYVVVSGEANENYSLLTGGNDHAGASTSAGAYTLALRNL